MKLLNPYLNFDGTAREAMTFYAKHLDAKLEIMSNKDMGAPAAAGDPDRVMHARVSKGPFAIMASDTPVGKAPKTGNSVWISVDCDDLAEIDRLFKAFSAGGKVMEPLADQMWGARWGCLYDKFGVAWMFNCYLPKK